MRVERYKDFISEEERLELVKYFDISIEQGINFLPGLDRGQWGYTGRVTTRNNKEVVYPDIVNNIFDRIINSFTFTNKCHKENVFNTKNVICVSTNPGYDTYLHQDGAFCEYGFSVIRFNIILQKPDKGGILELTDFDNKISKFDFNEKELYCCNLSDYPHYVTTTEGSKPRYIILFSMCCNKDDWETGKIKFKG
jgi:hypothetical protein